jgi:preprotein translocase subunit YajC
MFDDYVISLISRFQKSGVGITGLIMARDTTLVMMMMMMMMMMSRRRRIKNNRYQERYKVF